jgi:hypothetical protein
VERLEPPGSRKSQKLKRPAKEESWFTVNYRQVAVLVECGYYGQEIQVMGFAGIEGQKGTLEGGMRRQSKFEGGK